MSAIACKPVKERRRSLLPGPKAVGVTGLTTKCTALASTAESSDKYSASTAAPPIGKSSTVTKTTRLNGKLLPKKSAKTGTSSKETNNNCISQVLEDPSIDVRKHDRYNVGSVCQLGEKTGILRYCGQVCFAQGEWCGVELNEPTGKHDGLVKGKRYFTCREKYGVFVPIAKVTITSGPQSLCYRGDTVLDNHSKGTASQSTVTHPTAVGTGDNRKIPSCTASNDKHRGSKLLQPKLTSKSQVTRSQTDRSQPSGDVCGRKQRVKSGESRVSRQKEEPDNNNCTFNVSQNNNSSTQVCDLTYTATDFIDKSPQKSFLLEPKVKASDTFRVGSDSFLSVSPAKKHKFDPDKEPDLKQLNNTFVVAGECCETSNTVKTEIAECVKCNDLDSPLDKTHNIMSHPEESDLLSTANISHASSLGILSEQELCDDNLLTTALDNGTHEWVENLSKCSKWIDNELDEKDLDLEIAGIPTPDQEVSSQGSTGREDSSPDLDVTRTAGLTHTTLDLTFHLNPGQTSTPTSPYKRETDTDNIHIVKPKLSVELKKVSEARRKPVPDEKVSLVAKQKAFYATFVIKDGNANEVDQNEEVSPETCPKRLKTSSDTDHAAKALNASFELAKTAVSQYAELVKGAEKERLQSLRKKENRLSLIEFHSTSFLHDDLSDQKLLRHSFHEDLLRPKAVCGPLDTSECVNNLWKDYGKHVDTKGAHTEVLYSREALDSKKVLQRDDIIGCERLNFSTVDVHLKDTNTCVHGSGGGDKTGSLHAQTHIDPDDKPGQVDSENINSDVTKQEIPNEIGLVHVSDNRVFSGLGDCKDSVKGKDRSSSRVLILSGSSRLDTGLWGDSDPCRSGEVTMEKTGYSSTGEEEAHVVTSHRPTSFVSTTSADTGNQPDTDSECGLATDQPTVSPTLSSDSATLKEDQLSTSSQFSQPDRTTDPDTSCQTTSEEGLTQRHTEENPPSVEVPSSEDSLVRCHLDEARNATMNLSETPDHSNEAWNNNIQTAETDTEVSDGTTSGETGHLATRQSCHLATKLITGTDSDTDTQGQVMEGLAHQQTPGMSSPELTSQHQPAPTPSGEQGEIYIAEMLDKSYQDEGSPAQVICESAKEGEEEDAAGLVQGDRPETDNENNHKYTDLFTENNFHNDNLQNENEAVAALPVVEVIGETAPDLGVYELLTSEARDTETGNTEAGDTEAGNTEAGDAEDGESVDTDYTQKAEEMEMLDMSWDNMMEFTQIKDKQVGEFVSEVEDLALISGEIVLEVMDTECQDSSQSVDTSRDECPETAATTEQSAVKASQKRKGKTAVRETKSSRLRGARESPEKVLDKEGTAVTTGSPKRDMVEGKVPVVGRSLMKKPLPVSPKKPADSYKPKTAITKLKSGISSQFKKPLSGPTEAHNPGEIKHSKVETKSLHKRKTDSSASAHPVPSKKAASSAKAGKHSSQSVSQKGDASSTSKSDLNVSSSSTEAKTRPHSRPLSASKKTTGVPKSRVDSGEKRSLAEPDTVGKSQSTKSKLQVPKVTGGKKTASGKEESNIPATVLSKHSLRRSTISTANPSALPSGRVGGSRPNTQHTRLVTSTPKTLGGRQSLDIPSTSMLNASYDSSMPSPRTKALAGKPSNRATQALKKRERSASIGSDSQTSVASLVSTLSNISRVSTQGSANTRGQESTLNSSVVDGAVPSKAKRTGLKKRELSEPRKLGISVTTDGRIPTKTKSSYPLASSSPKKNQNRNSKPGTAPGKTSTQSSNKQSQQSTTTTQLVSSAQANRDEITRLEALCESRTKELNYAKMQFRQSVAGFEAMSVLVKYLTEELGAFSLPEVCSQLQRKEKLLCEAQSQLKELTVQRDALIEEIQCIQELCTSKMDKLKQEHSEAVASIKEQNHLQLLQLSEKHKEDTSLMKTSHEKRLLEIRKAEEVHTEELERHHSLSLETAHQESQAKLTELTKQHEDALNDITVRFEDIKMTLSEKLEYLRGECDMLRKREKDHMDTFQRDSDMKVQLAIQPFQQLPAEIDSLKAVLDMRNEEIHQLRRQKLQLEKELEVLPKAQDQIRGLQHKNENLEAIINIRSDYEKSLTEKNQVLLRKLDRESKANKRLSMEYEEFQWRASQNEGGIGDLMSRSISHSPTSSASSTPEPTRKRQSPLPTHSPRSPRTSGTDFDRHRSPRTSGSDLDKRSKLLRSNGELHSPRSSSGSDYGISPRSGDYSRQSAQDSSLMSISVHSEPSTSTPNKGTAGLKRSGTYELLDQEFENGESASEDVKQTDV